MNTFLSCCKYSVCFLFLFFITSEAQIKHRFIVSDEGTKSISYVDQFDTTKNWSIYIGQTNLYDLQLIGNNHIIGCAGDGYVEIDLVSKTIIKKVSGFKGQSHTLERLTNGKTILGGNTLNNVNGPGFLILNKNDSILSHITFTGMGRLRHLRSTLRNTLLITTVDTLLETTLEGTILHKWALPGSLFKAVMFPDQIVVSSGPSSRKLYFVDTAVVKNTKILYTIVGDSLKEGSFVGFQFLKRNSFVVACWLGHGAFSGNDLWEYDSLRKPIWNYRHPNSSLGEVIILDNLNTNFLHNEKTGILAPDTCKDCLTDQITPIKRQYQKTKKASLKIIKGKKLESYVDEENKTPLRFNGQNFNTVF